MARKVKISLSPRTVDLIESECHRRDCDADTLISEWLEVERVKGLEPRDPMRERRIDELHVNPGLERRRRG